MSEKRTVEKSKERLEILKEIEYLEKTGQFDKDVEKDPPSIMLLPEEVDYLNEKITSRAKTRVANRVGEKFLEFITKSKKLIVKDIYGIENFNSVDGGAVITCNHFNPFDFFAVETAFRKSKLANTKTMYKVIKEGNYTNFPGFYGFLFRHGNTLPLSSNQETMKKFMKAVDTILKSGNIILIYPEQSLWWNYKKPKPLKQGAFRIAARNNVPVVPIFITMEDSTIIGEDGFAIQEYTVNIGKPIYPENVLTEKENTQIMKTKNFEYWQNIYENFYNVPLEYLTQR